MFFEKCGGYFTSDDGFKMKGCDKICIGKKCSFSHGVVIMSSDSISIGDML